MCDIESCQNHHYILHAKGRVPEANMQSEGIVAHTKSYDKDIIVLEVTPIKIKAEGREVETYASFDEAATVTLLDKTIADRLDLMRDPFERD
ncbi:hypothetical protein JTB14_002046 [Gonioctena quinquepunctata]|nr:hypothetical protein JTB14_002046 [Gonioctena quinquepunctata]